MYESDFVGAAIAANAADGSLWLVSFLFGPLEADAGFMWKMELQGKDGWGFFLLFSVGILLWLALLTTSGGLVRNYIVFGALVG